MVSYAYTTWGKLRSMTGTLATTLGVDNPFRYRGYYYDTETGLYYLQSRYYDPETCRFLNGDVLMSTGQGVLGYNMFAYCMNSPIVLRDSHGTRTFSTMMTDGGGGKNAEKKSTFSTEVAITGLYRSAEAAARTWANDNVGDVRNDHRERGALIYSVTIDESVFYYTGNTFVGNNKTVAGQFLITYLGAKNVTGFVHIHTAYPPNATRLSWDTYDRGPSDADYFLFNLPGINSQFLMNELGNFYPFFEGEPVDLEEINKG